MLLKRSTLALSSAVAACLVIDAFSRPAEASWGCGPVVVYRSYDVGCCPPAVVYRSPVYYYTPRVYYAAPRYATRVYYSRPYYAYPRSGFGFSFSYSRSRHHGSYDVYRHHSSYRGYSHRHHRR